MTGALEKDKDFLSKMGGRTMVNEKKDEKKEPSLSDEIEEKIKESAKGAAVLKGWGIDPGNAMGGKEENTEAMKTAKQAMDMQTATMNSIDKARELTQDALTRAEASKNEAMTALFKFQMEALKDAEKKAVEATDKAKEGGSHTSEFDSYERIKGIVDKIAADTRPAPPAPIQQGRSDDTEIKLKHMELEQSRLLVQIETDRIESKREWDLKLLEFNEESRQRWAEYNDSKNLKAEGLRGFQDLAEAIGSGISQDRGGGEIKEEAGDETDKEETLQASVSQFKCNFCGETVTVESGQTEVFCPNEECGARYEVKKK